MAVLENSVEIARPPEEVFDALVDLRNELVWNPDVVSMEKITDGPIGVGTRFRAKWKQSKTVIVECTKYDRPRTWGYHNGGQVEVDFSVVITPRGEGSLVVGRFDARPRGWFRLVFPLFLILMRRAEKANFRYIKAYVEGTKSRENR